MSKAIKVSKAYTEYMKLANVYFEHLKNHTNPTPEEAKNIQEQQDILWEEMDDEEKWQADDTVLRTSLWINGK